jgi:nucleoside-diphosphate-sugar epimerase
MRILVTGANGAIGRYLCRYLSQQGHSVFRTDIVADYGDDYILADIVNPQALIKVFSLFKPEVVYHLAAIYGRLANERYANDSVNVNIIGTNNIIQLCKQFNSKLIFFSTSEVYGNIGGKLIETRTDLSPNNRYGILKLFCERLIKYEVDEHHLQAIILRPNMVYSEYEPFGSYRSALIRFTESLIKKQKVTLYCDSSRSWIYILDAVRVFEKCLYLDFDGQIINVAHPTPVDTKYVVLIICEILGLSYDEYVKEENTPRRMTQEKNVDVSKMTYLTGITPEISIEQGIDIVINKVRERLKYE